MGCCGWQVGRQKGHAASPCSMFVSRSRLHLKFMHNKQSSTGIQTHTHTHTSFHTHIHSGLCITTRVVGSPWEWVELAEWSSTNHSIPLARRLLHKQASNVGANFIKKHRQQPTAKLKGKQPELREREREFYSTVDAEQVLYKKYIYLKWFHILI